jgi:hypothetical protein
MMKLIYNLITSPSKIIAPAIVIYMAGALCIASLPLSAQDTLITDSKGTAIPQSWLIKISMEIKNKSLPEALSYFLEETQLYLNYNDTIIPIDRRISLKVKDIPAISALLQILEDTNIEILVSKSGQIVLVKSQKVNRTKSKKKFTVSGFINDAKSGEVLSGTNIYIEKLQTGAVANVYGFYSITLPAGQYTIVCSFVGYQSKKVIILLNQNLKKNIELEPSVLSGDTINVTANAEVDFLKSTEIGVIKLAPAELRNMPVLFGEQDILKTLHLLPGVTMTREGDSGFNVRGGNSDQNLVLLDEAPVYNAFHFFGFFSVFNSDAVSSFKLMKGPSPPKYGGKLSSVLDIQMNEGNYKNYHGNIGVGSIFSRFTLEGPIKKDKSSFVISGRRTYADFFARLFGPGEVKNSSLYFYDFNLKANYRLSQNNRIFLSGYFGRDVLDINNVFRNIWGNNTGTLRWNHIFNQKLFLNSSLVFSDFAYSIKVEDEDEPDGETVEIKNNINTITLKEDFQYFPNTRSSINFGLHVSSYNFLPGDFSTTGNSPFHLQIGKRKAREGAVYLAHEWDATNRLKLNYGLRYSHFIVNGLGDSYDFSNVTDVPFIEFHQQENARYGGLEPRFTASYQLNEKIYYKFGYARNYQNIHMISRSTPGTPLDVWQPSSSRLKPQCADQVSVGYFRNLEQNTYEFSVELFYKYLRNQVDFRNGAEILTSTLFESNLVTGIGYAYGIEFFLKRKMGNLTGWIGYSLARSRRRFEELNQGKVFPTRSDRTHDFSIVASYNLNPKWNFSGNWVYFTGNALTIPYGKYAVNGHVIEAYSERNAFRMPAYHRLDISCTYTMTKGHTWNFSLYNAYGRKNAYAILIEGEDLRPEKLSLFSFVPSLSFNYIF